MHPEHYSGGKFHTTPHRYCPMSVQPLPVLTVTPVLRIERGTGLFPFLAILSNRFDALYAGRTFVLRGIGR